MINLNDLTKEQREQLITEVIDNLDIKAKMGLFQVAMLQLGKISADSNAKSTTVSTEATYNDKRYNIEMSVILTEI